MNIKDINFSELALEYQSGNISLTKMEQKYGISRQTLSRRFKKLGIDVIIKYNNRKILTGLIEKCKISESKIADTITIIDKFEKLTREEITQEFKESGLVIEQIDELINYMNMDFEQIKEVFKETKNYELKNGIQEVAELNKYIEELNLSKYVKFTATLARGQEYYTGTIF